MKTKSNNIAKNIAGLLVGCLGFSLGYYAWNHLIVPIFFTFLCAWLISKMMKHNLRPMIPAIAIQFGLIMWILIGSVLTRQFLNLVECVAVLVSLGLLIKYPKLSVVLFLAIYQAISILMNLYALSFLELGSDPHKGLLTAIFLRILSIIFMFVGLRIIKKTELLKETEVENKVGVRSPFEVP